MSLLTTAESVVTNLTCRGEKSHIFQDLPIIDKNTRLTVVELRHTDKQVINELVYRWCRLLTRISPRSSHQLATPSDIAVDQIRKVLIIDMLNATNPIRLATVLKRNERRMRMVAMTRGCKINSTYPTIQNCLGGQANISASLKLVVIYQDEFFIVRTLDLIKDLLRTTKCQVLFVVPKLDRREHDILNLISNYQILKGDFCTNRQDIRPALINTDNDSYHTYLNQIYFTRTTMACTLPKRVDGELKEDGLCLHTFKPPKEPDRPTPILPMASMDSDTRVKKWKMDDSPKMVK